MFASSLISILLVSFQLAEARPATPAYKKHATVRTRSLPDRRAIKTYHPASQFEVYGRGLSRRDLASEFDPAKFGDAGLKFVHSKFGSADDDDDMEVVSSYDNTHTKLVYVRQRVGGVPVANTLANVAMNGKGDVLSFSSNFVPPKKGSSFKAGGGYDTTPQLSADEAASFATNSLGGRHDTAHPPALAFWASDDGDLKLTHSVRMHLDDGHIVQSFVDAKDGKVHGVIDYTAELSARAVSFTAKDVTEGHDLLTDVEDLKVSPHGWTFAEGGKIPAGMTLGNNVYAASLDTPLAEVEKQEQAEDLVIKAATKFTSNGTFDYAVDIKQDPTTRMNRDASVVNVWYVSNMAHDVLYRYGFTEKAFNFQLENAAGDGKANDPVIISVQESSGKNNAQFSTLPDGEASYMMTFLFNETKPERDSGLDNSVILHEYFHGVTNRMTGGGTAQCLQTPEAGGLGEGWSDAFANWVWQSTTTHFRDFSLGGFVVGNETATIRSHPYSMNRAVNPLTYADAKGREEVHAIGEIWAQVLFNVHANLVREWGADLDSLTNPDGEKGHAVFMHLVLDALAIQPCNPTFVTARDAIIQADVNRYQGKHRCALWIGFGYMGLGLGADNFVNSHNAPKDCPLPIH